MKIIKLYLDIGCCYQGDEYIENIYQDIENWNIKDCGIISMLKLLIDMQNRTTEEISFKQILGPMYKKFKCSISDYRKYTSCILREFKDVDLFVTFNGRDFDLPIILNNLNLSEENKDYHIRYFTGRDRDLLDCCLLKDINIKGGLREIVRRLRISYEEKKEKEIKEEICFLEDFEQHIRRYNDILITRKRRNESDIRVLPLLEEKLGVLYEPRSYFDKYHKKWI